MESEAKRQVISGETSKQICEFLEGVVGEGTGKNAYVAGYRVGGKTGTSEKLNSDNKRIASFGAIAPSDDVKIAVLMLLDEPSVANPYGGTLCAPMVGKILQEILPYLEVTPEYSEEEAEELAAKTPDVMGKSLSDAKSEISQAGLKVSVVGDGDSVVRQVPAAAESIPKGGTVVVYTDVNAEQTTTTVPNFEGMTVSQANAAAVNAGLNIQFGGSTTDAVAYDQSIAADTTVEKGTVVTVEFRENIVVE